MRRTHEISIASISLGCFLFLLYHHPFVHNFWLFDDPFILRYAAEHPAWSYFFDPQTWNLFSSAHFTPMVVLSYSLDYHLFGPAPKWFYLHSLLSLWALCILLYLLLRRHIPIWAAVFGVLFFILSKPFAAATEILMFRHYIEGAVFACLAAYFFLSALKDNSISRAGWAAIIYLLAMLCKEVYIPLPLILCFVPQGLFWQRMKMCLFFCLSLIVYLGWRFWMLGAVIGGFSGSLMAGDPQNGFTSLLSVPHYLASVATEFSGLALITAACLGLLLFLPLAYHIAKRHLRILAFVLAGIVAVTVPLLPIAPYLQDTMLIAFRLSFAAMLAFSIYLALAVADLAKIQLFRNLRTYRYVQQLPRLVIHVLLAVVTLGSGIQSTHWIYQQKKQTTEPLSTEGRFIWQEEQPGILVRSHNMFSTHYYQSLNYFKTEVGDREPLLVVADGFGLLSNVEGLTAGQPRYFAYRRQTQEISEVTFEVKKKRKEMLSSIGDSQFRANFEVDHGSFALNLSTTQEQKTLFMLLGYLPGMYCDAFPFPGQKKITFNGTLYAGLTGYFRFGQHDLAKHTVSLSPEWWIDFSQTREITWPKE
jgi:hypothetical protein